MLDDCKRLKEEFPERILIASIMEEYNQGAWEEIVGRCEEAGCNAFEINFSCPHGMPERKMGTRPQLYLLRWQLSLSSCCSACTAHRALPHYSAVAAVSSVSIPSVSMSNLT